jgi:hypothetical protein
MERRTKEALENGDGVDPFMAGSVTANSKNKCKWFQNYISGSGTTWHVILEMYGLIICTSFAFPSWHDFCIRVILELHGLPWYLLFPEL